MSKATQFEESIQSLEQIVAALEKGDTSLDDALKQFEKGITLTRTCQKLLTAAEQKIEALAQKNPPKEPNLDN
jgi:exodeoxyribonuclease VII small subunit